ncbi:S-layer family protein [Mucilaginibacter sp. AK015]|uniref:beta strand repeat-containing protein n=1 Tax=Mucilaginibacter sp. AK015 TaxID=2723072 RepID=UPI00161B9606|nr:cadherin-like beta sandwich domain-containing protein [Mucilaginibacter sp. AK015]MBB5395746.1 gliding motility-associated-like protein [Mucilaginibacter sp. AK015]
MKTLLLFVKKLMIKSRTAMSAAVLLLVLSGITQSTHAQVYYLLTSGKGNVSDPANALKKIDYNGANDVNVTTGFPNPGLIEVDAPNNRIFTYNGFLGSRVINVINMTSGAVINTISLPSGIQVSGPSVTAIKYDPINDWLYYVTNSNTGTANDLNALYRSKPDGSQNTTLAKQFALLPNWLALDIPNNRVFINEGIFNARKILTFDLGSNTVTANAAMSNIVNAISYDPVTDYIYYITSDNDQLNTGTTNGTTNDALRKVRPGGAGGEIVVRSSVVISPQYMALDAGNNRAYVYNGYYGSSTTIRLSNTGIYAVDLTTGNTTLTLDHSGLQNTPNYIRVMGLFAPARPIVNTTTVSTFSSSSATLGGNVTRSDAAVTARGVVYSSSNATPTIGAGGVTQAANGSGTGSFSASVTGLSASTTYYVRSYATSGAGTTYGAVTSFSTQSNDATLSGLSISAGTLTPAFSSATVSYTASVSNATSTITVTPAKTNGNASITVNGTAVNSGSASGAINLNIGDNVITTVVTAQDGLTTKTYTLTVNRAKAAQTITFAATATKTYGDADFAPGATASSGLTVSYSSDNTNVATIVAGQVHIVGAGTANITASQAGDGNYLAASNAVQSLTVNKASQTITFSAPPAKVYGNADFAPGATASSGLPVTYSSDNSAVATIVSNQIHIVAPGSATITASQAGDANRSAATSVTQLFTFDKATVTVTAAAKTKVYGDSDPALTYTATGVVGTDAPTGALTRAPGRFIGDYAITQGTLSYGANYNINYVSANLTITKRSITIIPVDKTKVYGDPDPNYPYQLLGGASPEDGMTGQFERNDGEDVGTHSILIGTKRPIDLSNGQPTASNYNITFIPGTLTITAKPLAVNVYSQTKTYGDADPTLTYTSAPLAFSDTFTGALTRDAGENVGTYAINQGTLALSSNYNIIFVGANLNIGVKTLNVTANAQTKTYGDADPALTYTADALAAGDSFTGSLTREAGENTGAYAITQGTLALSSNYTLNYTGANLSINKATLTYVATPASRPYQNPDPTFTGTVTGFVNGDDQVSATAGTLSFSTTATQSSPVGSYPIAGAGLSAANYDFVQAAENSTAFTITASNNATLSALTIDQGTLSPAFNSTDFNYSANVDNTVTSFNFSATSSNPDATILVNGQPYASGTTKNIALNTGGNYIIINVTAQDGTTVKGYSLNIFRAYSTNNQLASLTLNGVTYSPSFNTNTLDYTASVANLVASTDVTATAADNTAKVLVNGYDLAQSSPVTVSLNVGETVVGIVVKAENGDDRVYKVIVTRDKSADATLASIGNSSVTLNTPFISALHTYSATVASNISSLNFLPIASSDKATIKINDQSLNTALGNNVNLAFGANTIVFDITAEDGTHTGNYTLNVYRARSSDATLANLSFPSITSLNETFDPAVYSYTATVADSTYTGIPLTAVSADVNAVVKIDGTVVPRFQNYSLPVHGGPNTYKIVVTSQDTSAVKTYTLVLTRAGTPPPVLSPVAELAAITITGGTGFSKNFNLSFDELTTVNAPNSVTAIAILPVSANSVSTVTVNGQTVPYDNFTGQLPLAVGDNTYTIIVTSQDGANTRTYTLHVNRLPYADITLASLTINKGTLTPAFSPGTKTYTVTVPNIVNELTVTPVASSNTATIAIGATTINASTPSATVSLPFINNPANRIRVVVTAPDGVNTQTYTLNVTRELSAVTAASFVLTPSSKLVASTGAANVNYVTSVDPATTSVSIKPTLVDADGTVTINGNPVTSGTASAPITLSGTATLINIVVTAPNGSTVRTYGITVNRMGSNNSTIDLKLTPASKLIATTGTSTVNYVTSVDPATTSVTVTPVAQNAGAVIMINGEQVNSGTPSGAIPLNGGTTVINTVVTSQDGTSVKTYSVTVNRTGSNNAIATLKINPLSTLTLVDGPSTQNYITSVDPGTTSVTVTPTAQNAGATITVNGAVVVSGTASDPIALSGVSTTINTIVTAQDGTTIKTYSITVNRTGSTNAFASLKLDPASPLVSADGPGTVNYTTTVNPNTSSVKVTTNTQEPNATIKVNGVSQISGVPSAPIPLTVGVNTIETVVTAQDGVTARSYIITATRPKSNNAIASLKLTPASSLVAATGPSTVNYAAFVAPSTTSVIITPTAGDANATIKVNGVSVVSGSPSAPIALNAGATLITTVVTADDGTTVRSYSITVNRTGSNNAIVKLKLTPASTLITTTGVSTVNYNAMVAPDITSVNVTPVAQDPTATITINGVNVATGTASAAIPLNDGPTLINTVVTAQDGVTIKTYSITVYRTGSNNAILSSIRLSPNKLLTATTGSATVNYSANVDFGTTSIAVVPVAQQADATIDVAGELVASGATSTPIALSVGANTILTTVTAQDGSTVKTYAITVNRAPNTFMVNKADSKLLFANNTGNNLTLADDDGVVVHQGVSPNGDGSNDFLYIEGIDAYAGNKLSIMNTSGSLVFQASNYGKDGNNVFDGHSNKTGAQLKPGTYYYSLEYKVGNNNKRKTGYIILKY